MDGWHPRYFNPRKLPFNWAGGDHEWAITERTARGRHGKGEDLAVGYESDAEVGHTMVRPLPQGVTSIEHRDPASGRLLHASVAERRLVRLAVSAPDGPLIARNHHPLVRFGRPGHTQKRVPRVAVDWARETGFSDPAFYASGDPLPTLPELTGWDGVEAVAELCAALPRYAADLAGLPWHAYADDAPERVASILERLGAPDRLAEIFAPDDPPAPTARRWFGRRTAPDSGVDQDEPWSIGAAGLDALLAATGRRFGKHPDDRSRILTAPVADGEVILAVTVETRPARHMAATGLLVYLPGAATTWAARPAEVQGPVFTDEGQFRRALDLGLAVFDAYAEEFTRPVERRLEPVDLPAPY